MVPVATATERRHDRRLPGGGAQWNTSAVLRPGQPVTLVNISRHAALLESPSRLRPGACTELQLTGDRGRACVRGRLDRCFVAALEPLRYRGVIVFDQMLVFDGGDSERAG